MTINAVRHVEFGALLAAALGLATPVLGQTAVKFSLDWKYEGTQSPFLLALDRGYFKAEGLDVTIDTAGGSVEPINRLASRTYDMAFGDINSLIKFRDQNPQTPLKAIFMIYSNPPFAIVTRKSRGITSPKDLEGKKLGAPTADGAYAQWPIFVKANNIDASKVENSERRLRGARADAGVRPGRCHHGIFVLHLHQREAWRRPARRHRRAADGELRRQPVRQHDHGQSVVRRRQAAGRQGIPPRLPEGAQGHHENPAAAINSVLKRNETASKEIELERLQLALRDNILTPEVKANGFGGVDPSGSTRRSIRSR